MAQKTTGVRAVLSHPAVYNLFQDMLGRRRVYRLLVRDYFRPAKGARVLDIGCGPGDLLPFLGDVEYVGFDLSERYIEAAQSRFGDRGTFYCQRVGDETLEGTEPFDIALAIGLVHHLDDGEARHLFASVRTGLRDGGRLVTVDPCLEDGQSPVARWLIDRDRGQNIRTSAGYVALADGVFEHHQVDVRHDLPRIPYTHCIMTLTR